MTDQVPSGLRSSRTGRVPQWVLDEAEGRALQPVPFRAAPSSRRSRAWGRRLTTGLAVAGLVGVALFLQSARGGSPTAVLSADGQRSAPPPGREETDRGPVPPAPQGVREGTTFRFLHHTTPSGGPVTWSPCRPVHYVVRPQNAPAGGAAMLSRAVEAVSGATGLRFVDDGSTDEGPSEERQAYQPERYGDRWAPVLVTWATADEVPDFGVDIAGEAGPVSVGTPSGDRTYVSGTVYLDAAKLGALAAQTGPVAGTTVIAHELGHLVGLSHVNDPQQVMYPRAGAQPQYGTGDLAGLALLGRGPCQPDV